MSAYQDNKDNEAKLTIEVESWEVEGWGLRIERWRVWSWEIISPFSLSPCLHVVEKLRSGELRSEGIISPSSMSQCLHSP